VFIQALVEDGPRSRDRPASETGKRADVDRHSVDSSQLGTVDNERHGLLNGTESNRVAVGTNDVANENAQVGEVFWLFESSVVRI